MPATDYIRTINEIDDLVEEGKVMFSSYGEGISFGRVNPRGIVYTNTSGDLEEPTLEAVATLSYSGDYAEIIKRIKKIAEAKCLNLEPRELPAHRYIHSSRPMPYQAFVKNNEMRHH